MRDGVADFDDFVYWDVIDGSGVALLSAHFYVEGGFVCDDVEGVSVFVYFGDSGGGGVIGESYEFGFLVG